jgi:hypothetical protein
MVLLALAAATALVYAAWVVWVPLLPSNLYTPLLDLGQITGYTWSSASVYLLVVVVLFALYGLGYSAVLMGGIRVKTRWLFVPAAIFCLEMLWAYPATAADVFSYIAAGQLLALHHANPLVVAPNAYPADAIVPYLVYPAEPSQYGPAWALLSGAIASLTGTNLLAGVLAYKLVAAAAHLASGTVIYRIARKLTTRRRVYQASVYVFLWNPLVLWEVVGNAHNDGLMLLFGLLGVWLYLARQDVLALMCVAAGALVKVPIALIGPVVFVGALRRKRAAAIEGSLAGLALAFVVFRPFWEGSQTLTALQRTELFTASLASVLRLALASSLDLTLASSVARTVSLSIFAVVAVLSVLRAWVAETDAERLRPAYWILLAGVLLLTTWFQAWYIVWVIGIGAALAEPRRHFEVALLSLGGLLQYFVFIYLWVIGVFPQTDTLAIQLTACVAILGPFLVALLWRATTINRWKRTLRRVHAPAPRATPTRGSF